MVKVFFTDCCSISLRNPGINASINTMTWFRSVFKFETEEGAELVFAICEEFQTEVVIVNKIERMKEATTHDEDKTKADSTTE